jgi:hypothetical protein
MPINPGEPLSVLEQATFGVDALRHPITGVPLERGSGALPVKQQARNHLAVIAQQESKAVAAETGKRLDEFEASGGAVNMPTSAPAAATATVIEIKRRNRSTSPEQSNAG